MSPIHGAIINWFAHKYGYRNFEVGDTSRNFSPRGFSHDGRKLPQQPPQTWLTSKLRWFPLACRIDPTYQVIKVLNKLGVIDMVKQSISRLSRYKKATIYFGI